MLNWQRDAIALRLGQLDENGLPFQRRKDHVKLRVDRATIAYHTEMFREIALLVKRYSESWGHGVQRTTDG